ncbi:MAG: leucine--tRNA ligase [Chitinophagaceae bacterium]
MEYNFRDIEKKWQQQWKESNAYSVSNDVSKPKFYVLDMFPYPSGTGLHVGHPLGYIASDIYSRYKRLKGFNVLHPMGYDSFGLPAEQYALETGQHPSVTTEQNITTFRTQLDKIGFSFDWSREVRTSDPQFYKWTQWIFLQLYNSWYDRSANKARPINELLTIFEKEGSLTLEGRLSEAGFGKEEWDAYDEKQRHDVLMNYRLAYSSFGEVNWCENLGTVLANDEVINGVSERGGHPVVKKKMRQWYLRITEYADRLLQGLEQVEFTESLKEQQRNWIGKSQGAEINFKVKASGPGLAEEKVEKGIKVYTTRPDTIFGVDFMVLAPEHELVVSLTTPDRQDAVNEYLGYVKSRSDRERMSEVKQITGCSTGAFAINPFDGREIPVWIAEYVLAGYGTGAIMAVPCSDQRDYDFAVHFEIPITNIIGSHFNGNEANPTKDAVLENSGFLNGMAMKEAITAAIDKLEELEIGRRQVNYRMRDAGFSRQRYWGEPFPIIWKEGMSHPLPEKDLPLELPHVEKYEPGPEGEGPLANITEWANLPGGGKRETSTMPGYAGSSWYFLRYMDPHNHSEFCNRKVSDYWGQVDLYIGGTEHAVGHLLYSRMWTKVLYDLAYIGHDEPYKKLVNQGMIQGSSRFVYRIKGTNQFVSAGLKHSYDTNPLHIDVNMVDGFELDIEAFRRWKPEFENARFILENGEEHSPGITGEKGVYICGAEIEKMSKSKFNAVNPDQIVEDYGADTFRMYEMFLGPIEQSKPWDTKGIEGVHRFLRKLWRLFYDDLKGKVWNTDKATEAELKVLHRTIKKIEDDTEKFSFNTAVSAFMVCVNELVELKCHKEEILMPLLILMAPYAPHISEELLYQVRSVTRSGENVVQGSVILEAAYPVFEEKFVQETAKEYPVSVNGKVRTNITISLSATQEEVEQIVLDNDTVQKWLGEKLHKKIIYVKGKMVNVVL